MGAALLLEGALPLVAAVLLAEVIGLVGTSFSLRAALTLSGVLLMPVAALYARTLQQARHGDASTPALEV